MKSRKTTRSATLNNRLAAYSATATAALLAAPAANAAIQNITDFLYQGNTVSSLNINSNGNILFQAENKTGLVGLQAHLHIYLHGNTGTNSISLFGHGTTPYLRGSGIAKSHRSVAANLMPGAGVVGLNFNTSRGADKLELGFSGVGPSSGNFAPHGSKHTDTGYVAFKTKLRGHTYYGWLHIKIGGNDSNCPNDFSLVANSQGDYGAFDVASDVAADNFKVGSVSAVPEPSTTALAGLGLLALGAAGIREYRRRRNLADKN